MHGNKCRKTTSHTPIFQLFFQRPGNQPLWYTYYRQLSSCLNLIPMVCRPITMEWMILMNDFHTFHTYNIPYSIFIAPMLSLPYSSIYSFFFFSPSLLQTFDKCFLGSSRRRTPTACSAARWGRCSCLARPSVPLRFWPSTSWVLDTRFRTLRSFTFIHLLVNAMMHESYEGSWMYCILHSFIHSN